MATQSYQLRLRALGALSVFLVLVIVSGVYQIRAQRLSEHNYRILGELNQLEATLPQLVQSGQHYVDNAPRDYESYFRDVAVFSHQIRADFDQIGGQLDQIKMALEEDVRPLDLRSLLGLDSGNPQFEQLNVAVAETVATWQAFQTGFDEAMGDDEEPRLEWGAKYVVDESPALSEAMMGMSKQYRAFLDDQRAAVEQTLKGGLIALFVFGALGLLWFYLRVIRRIGKTVEACAHVANGEFGYTLKVDGADEIGLLAQAFNMLSSRSRLVVAMLGDLQRARSVEMCLNVIINAAGSYLPVAWAGFMSVDRQNGTFAITHALPKKSISSWGDRVTYATTTLGQMLSEALVRQEPVVINDLRQFVLNHSEVILARDLVRVTRLESLVAIPLSSGEGWEGFLLFGSRSARYRQDQLELLTNLTPTLALSFERLALPRAA